MLRRQIGGWIYQCLNGKFTCTWYLLTSLFLIIICPIFSHFTLPQTQHCDPWGIQSYCIPLYLPMPWSWVNTWYCIYQLRHTPSTVYTIYSIHHVEHTPTTVYIRSSIYQVQYTPSTAYSKYSIHQVQHTPSAGNTECVIRWVQHQPNINCLSLPADFTYLISHLSADHIVLHSLHSEVYKVTYKHSVSSRYVTPCYAFGVSVIFPGSYKITRWSWNRCLIWNDEQSLRFLYGIYLPDLFTY